MKAFRCRGQRRRRIQEDWQKRGAGGLVSAVDPIKRRDHDLGRGTRRVEASGPFRRARTPRPAPVRSRIRSSLPMPSPARSIRSKARRSASRARQRSADGSRFRRRGNRVRIFPATFRAPSIPLSAAANAITVTDLVQPRSPSWCHRSPRSPRWSRIPLQAARGIAARLRAAP